MGKDSGDWGRGLGFGAIGGQILGGGKSGKDGAPSAPDPAAMLALQAKYNRTNTVNPFGSATWSKDKKGNWTQSQNYSSAIAPLFDRYTQIASGSNDEMAKQYFDRAMALMRPQMDQQRQQVDSTLAARGLPVGAQINRDAMRDFYDGQNRQQMALANESIALGEQLRNAEYQRIAQALGGLPQAGNAPIDVMGPYNTQYQGQMNQYNQQQAGKNAMLGTAGTLGAAAIMSSEEFKENKQPVGDVLPKIEQMRVEQWDYKPGMGDGGTHVGPYAEEYSANFGGPEQSIDLISMNGVMMKAIQELAAKLRRLEGGQAEEIEYEPVR